MLLLAATLRTSTNGSSRYYQALKMDRWFGSGMVIGSFELDYGTAPVEILKP